MIKARLAIVGASILSVGAAPADMLPLKQGIFGLQCGIALSAEGGRRCGKSPVG